MAEQGAQETEGEDRKGNWRIRVRDYNGYASLVVTLQLPVKGAVALGKKIVKFG